MEDAARLSAASGRRARRQRNRLFLQRPAKPASQQFLELVGVKRLVAMSQRGAEDTSAAVVVRPYERIRLAIFRTDGRRQRLRVGPDLVDDVQLVDRRDERRQSRRDRIVLGPL